MVASNTRGLQFESSHRQNFIMHKNTFLVIQVDLSSAGSNKSFNHFLCRVPTNINKARIVPRSAARFKPEMYPRSKLTKCSEQEEEHHLKLAADNGTWVLLTNVAFTQFMPGGVSSRFSSSS